MQAVLVYPPFADPTCPYPSLPYLASYVNSKSAHRVELVDANVEAFVHAANPAQVESLLTRAEERRRRLDSCRSTWGEREHQLDRDLSLGLGVNAQDVARACDVMRDPARFFDLRSYYPASVTLMRWLRLLCVDGSPGQFYGLRASNDVWDAGGNAVNLRCLSQVARHDVQEALARPFAGYYRDVLLPRLTRSQAPDVVGLSVAYIAQLPHALWLAAELRRQVPRVKVVLGGGEPTSLWKYTRGGGDFGLLLESIDAIVVGEGESALLDLLDAEERGGNFDDIDCVVTRSKLLAGEPVRVRYEHLDELPTPDYSDLPWSAYLAPAKLLHYVPSRGCYWGRCRFCDYGLSLAGGTTPWRERSVELVLEDLTRLSAVSRYVYFAVDTLAPGYVERLASGITAAGLDVRWAAELRPEGRIGDLAPMLAQSGCVAVSLGLESGCQRVLDLMGKGTHLSSIRRAICGLARAGIAVQVMAFTGFPTETASEAQETLQLLDDLRESWSFADLGWFVLLPECAVAKDPARFGIGAVSPTSDGRLGVLQWEAVQSSDTGEKSWAIERRRQKLDHPMQLERPFMGGTDSTHSLLYFERFGRNATIAWDSVLAVSGEDERQVAAPSDLVFRPRHGLRIALASGDRIAADLGRETGIRALTLDQLDILLAFAGGRSLSWVRSQVRERLPRIANDEFERAIRLLVMAGALDPPHRLLGG